MNQYNKIQKTWKCDHCKKRFDIEVYNHCLEYEGVIDICCSCYDKKFASCDGCLEDFYKDEILRYIDPKDNTENWYCVQCISDVTQEDLVSSET
jgi:hypothetical protein